MSDVPFIILPYRPRPASPLGRSTRRDGLAAFHRPAPPRPSKLSPIFERSPPCPGVKRLLETQTRAKSGHGLRLLVGGDVRSSAVLMIWPARRLAVSGDRRLYDRRARRGRLLLPGFLCLSPFGPDGREDGAGHRDRDDGEDVGEESDHDAEGAERMRILVHGGPGPERRGGDRGAEDERGEERTREEGAERDLAVEQEARRPEPEDDRGCDPGRDQDEPAVAAEVRGRDGHQRDEAARGEEPDSEPHLVGDRSDLDAPGACVEVPVDLADPEPPEEEAEHDRERGGKDVVGGASEELANQVRRRRVELHVRDQAVGERVLVLGREVEERDHDERRRQGREREVDAGCRTRVTARLEVAA